MKLPPSPETRDSSEISLERLNALRAADGEAARLVVKALGSNDADIRAAGAMKVLELQLYDVAVLDALAAAVRDPEAKVRFAAGFALGQFGAAGVAPLGAATADENVLVRLNAVQALNPFLTSSSEAVTLVEERLKQDKDPSVRTQAALALLRANHSHEAALTLLVDSLPGASSQLRDHIVQVLRVADRPLVVARLAFAARHHDKLMRREAVTTLVEIDPEAKETKNVVDSLLDDEDEDVRRAAIVAARQRHIRAEPS
jgi:HEAT repeat protein